MESWSAHQLYESGAKKHDAATTLSLKSYAEGLRAKGLPIIFTLGHLSKITGVSYETLRAIVNRRRETSNYRMFAVEKRSGGRRFIHSVSTELFRVQQFINEAILQPQAPHGCSFAFHSSGGVRKCAERHCRARWLFQFDLKDFFYDVTELDAFRIFQTMGYRELLAFEMARLCTTTHLPRWQKRLLYRDITREVNADMASEGLKQLPYPNRLGPVGVLPQGAPSSPMLSNLAAMELDIALHSYAVQTGLIYTRYADDLTFSAYELGSLKIAEINRAIVNRIRKARFRENEKKTRIAGPGSRKVVLGLLVDQERPRISKETYKRIDSHLHAVPIYGWQSTSEHWGFDSAFGFHNHLSGLISFVKDVDLVRWQEFSAQFAALPKPPWQLPE